MKKLAIIIGLALILAGCGNTSLHPNQIQYKEKVLTYGTTKIDDTFFEDGIDLFINDENVIRSITITNTEVLTYNDISVGDKISKVESKYNSEMRIGDIICVALNGNNEIDPASQDKPDDAIWINYFFDGDDIITAIAIYDVVYGREIK